LSLPRTPTAGPITLDQQATTALLQAAVKRVSAQRGTRLQLKMGSADLNGLVDGLVGTQWEETYVLELPPGSSEIRFGNSRKHGRIKWAINRATKLGVQVRPAEGEDDLRAWYDLYLDTMRWHAAPPRPYRFFKNCWELLKPRGLMQVLLAEQHEAGHRKLVSGSIFLMFGSTVFYAFNGRQRESLSLRPNDAIQWRAIHDAWENNFRYYDFGEVVEDNQGLAEFKSKWGAEQRWLYRYSFPAPEQSGPSAPSSTNHSYAQSLVKAGWRRLPLKMTALLGDLIFSYL